MCVIFERNQSVRCDDQMKAYCFSILPSIEKEHEVRIPRIIAPTVSAAENVMVRGQDLAKATGDSIKTIPAGACEPIIN